MNDFTSFAYAAHLATFLIYAGPIAPSKNNLKGKKRERGEGIYRATRAFFTAEFMIPVSKRARRGSRDKRVSGNTKSGESRLPFQSDCPQKIRLILAELYEICFKYIYIRNDETDFQTNSLL